MRLVFAGTPEVALPALTAVAAYYLFDLSHVGALLLGAVVGSTDAAAVFATLRNTALPHRVVGLLHAESGANDPMAVGAIEALEGANRKAQVVGINGSKEAVELIKSGKLLASGDFNGFIQGCIGTQIAVRNLRKEPTPKEVMLKPIVIDKSNSAPYEVPVEQRTCPTIEQIVSN
jgi:ribose transport system substrate-binding protein